MGLPTSGLHKSAIFSASVTGHGSPSDFTFWSFRNASIVRSTVTFSRRCMAFVWSILDPVVTEQIPFVLLSVLLERLTVQSCWWSPLLTNWVTLPLDV